MVDSIFIFEEQREDGTWELTQHPLVTSKKSADGIMAWSKSEGINNLRVVEFKRAKQ